MGIPFARSEANQQRLAYSHIAGIFPKTRVSGFPRTLLVERLDIPDPTGFSCSPRRIRKLLSQEEKVPWH